MIATAEAAPTHDTAIEILNDVLRRDPGNAKAGRLLRTSGRRISTRSKPSNGATDRGGAAAIEEHLTRNELDLAGTELDAAESVPVDGRVPGTARTAAGRASEGRTRPTGRAAVEQAQEDFARGNHQRAIADLVSSSPLTTGYRQPFGP